MTTGFLGHTGEHLQTIYYPPDRAAQVPSQYSEQGVGRTGLAVPGEPGGQLDGADPSAQATSWSSLMIGERIDTVRGRYDADPIYEAAASPDFVYGKPLGRWDFRLPPRWPYASGALSNRAVLGFMEGTQGYISRDHASAVVRSVLDMLDDSSLGGGRVTILSEPFKYWTKNDRILDLVLTLRELYGAHQAANVIRDDSTDMHGTRIWLARSGRTPFLLVERSEIVQGTDDTQTVQRLVEAVKVANDIDAMQVIQEFSLQEEVRVRMLLRQWQATPGEWRHVWRHASRRTVQSDHDLWRVVLSYWYPPPLHQRVGIWMGDKVMRAVAQLRSHRP